jgi:hypothetical protein
VDLVLKNQFPGLGHGGVRLAGRVLDDELDARPTEPVVVFIQVHPEAIDHLLAGLRKAARRGREKADAKLLSARAACA